MILEALVVIAIILGSVILHELMHGVVAYWLGDNTAKEQGRLTLNPIKHIDPYMSIIVPMILFLIKAPIFGGAKPVPINTRNLKYREWGMALVAIAGPLTNFLLALLSFLVGYFTGWLNDAGMLGFFFREMVMINLGFMVFNLIPIPPLDGSRVLYAIAPDGVRNVMMQMENFGVIMIYVLILILGGVFSQIMGGIMKAILEFFYLLVGA